MLEAWDHGAGLVDACRVDLGGDEADLVAAVGEHFAPRIDDPRVAAGVAVIVVASVR